MSEVINPWGPLGKPSKEQIQEWCNWPHGKFTEYKNMLTRKRRGKVASEHTVYVTKEVTDCYLAEVKVLAHDFNDAVRQLGYDYSKFNFENEPYQKERVSYSYRSVNPNTKW
jgi:hypothetical protein